MSAVTRTLNITQPPEEKPTMSEPAVDLAATAAVLTTTPTQNGAPVRRHAARGATGVLRSGR
jgi:hypothetical protein